jgi:hypothetical protein
VLGWRRAAAAMTLYAVADLAGVPRVARGENYPGRPMDRRRASSRSPIVRSRTCIEISL